MSNLKAKVDDLDADKLNTVPRDLKKLSDVVNKEAAKKLHTKGNKLDKKIPEATALSYINQYNTDKQNLEKKIGVVHIKIPDVSDLVTSTVLITKNGEVEKKIPLVSGLVTTTVLDTKIKEI